MDENRSASLDNEPLDDEQQTRKDMSYSPASERETAEKQADSAGSDQVLPGTGGPDDSGDVEAAPEDLHMPERGA